MSDETGKEAINEESSTLEEKEYIDRANVFFKEMLTAAQTHLDKQMDKLKNSICEAYWTFFKQASLIICKTAMKFDEQNEFSGIMAQGADQWAEMVCTKVSQVALKEVQDTMRKQLINGLEELRKKTLAQ